MLLLFFVTLLLAAVLTGLLRRYALTHKVLDIPNQRSSHSVPTPRGGGLAIVLAFYAAVLWLYFDSQLTDSSLALLGSALLVAAIGFCDDHGEVAARWRLLTHLLSAVIALAFLGKLPSLGMPAPFDSLFGGLNLDPAWLSYPIGTLFLVWTLNLFNFMDGTDGIAASEALFVSLALAAYLFAIDPGLSAVALSLAAACGGFLIWNWPKAKIFMGDVGSGFIGLLLGLLILLAAQQAAVMLYCGLTLFGVFIVDASYTLAIRMLSGQKWYAAHCSHTYQHAAKRHGHLAVLLTTWAVNCGWLLPVSLWIFKHPNHALAGIALAYLPLIFLAYRFQAGQAEFNPS